METSDAELTQEELEATFYPTYEEWKPSPITLILGKSNSLFILPMRNGNAINADDSIRLQKLFILPMRNGNDLNFSSDLSK